MRFLTLFLLLALAVGQDVFAQPVALQASGLIDVERGELVTPGIVVVDGEEIIQIGGPIPAHTRVINLGARVLMPGMMDAHTHMLLSTQQARDFGRFFITNVLESTAYRAIQGTANARSMLESGFTSIRDLGNNGYYGDLDLARAIREGWVAGPDMQGVGRIIAPFGGQFHVPKTNPDLVEPEYIVADTHDELRKGIRANLHYGTDLIKIVVDDWGYVYSEEDVRFVVDEVTAAGTKVAAHVATYRGAANAIAAGVHSLEHAWELTDQNLADMVEKGIVLVGTDFPRSYSGYFTGYDDELAEQAYLSRIERLRRAYEAGVTIAFGADVTDYNPGETRGSMTLEFLDSFRDAGVTPADLLRILTVNPAGLMGWQDTKGTLTVGKHADIIALPGNPLEDPEVLKQADFVMKRGLVYVRDGQFVWDIPLELEIREN
ncbi:MAG: amidohydrolase family protein [Rhodothermales bacterium]|nr:amidohydrolase family protein [Rhodothermales bacterium]MBO6780287.1 amidohydrolase family protein [Rhodothermales bacterium]